MSDKKKLEEVKDTIMEKMRKLNSVELTEEQFKELNKLLDLTITIEDE